MMHTQLDRAAIDAHGKGVRWLTFWGDHRDQFEAIPAGSERQRVVERVLHLLLTGDAGGIVPPEDGYGRPLDFELAEITTSHAGAV